MCNICIGPFGPCECVFTWKDEVLQPLTPRPMISCGVCVDVFCVRVLVLLLEAVQPRRWSWFVFALKTAASLATPQWP